MLDPRNIIAQLEKCDAMSRKDLRSYQEALLAMVLCRAREYVKLYQDRLDPVFGRDGKIDFTRWTDIPVLTKEELIACGDDKFDNDLPDAQKPFEWSATSGTTGKPFLAAKTRSSLLMAACINERLIALGELDTRKPLATIRYSKDPELTFPDGKTTRGWSLHAPGALSHTLSQETSTDQQIDWLQHRKPAYLTAYPSVAAEIALVMGADARRLGIEAVLTFGEAVLDDQRMAITEYLGARVVDAYSAQETGYIALQCPVSGDYHTVSGAVHLEIADQDGKLVPAGTEGDILITPFHNAVMPLIRYRIGDRGVMAAGRCGCGRTSPRLRTIGGRSRDMFHYADGSHRFANIAMSDLQAAVPLLQYQLVQHQPTDVELRYVPDPARTGEPDLEALARIARRDLHESVVIRVKPVDAISRTVSGKFARTRRMF